ncbi:MAG: ABC transporter substrate-binding protein, partial [Sneathiellaceae bacterium]
MRHVLKRTMFAAAAVSLLVATAPAPASAEPVKGGVLNIAMSPEPPMIVSAFNSSTFVGLISTKIYDGLVTYDFDMTPRPLLATSWDVSEDGLTYTFKLRDDVKWHDGKPFTSADVKFTLEKVWREMHPRGRTTFQHVSEVETPDDHTVVVKLNKPTPILMKALSSYESQVLPKHIFDDGQDIATHPALNHPIGTGPFKFKEWQKGDYIIVERNPDYWDQPKPHLDAIVWKIIPDAAARSAALETGEVHYAPFSRVPMADIPRLEALDTIEVESRGYEYLSPIFLMELNTRNDYLKHVKVRQAISHAIDRKFLVDAIWFGQGSKVTGPVPPSNVDNYTADVPDTVSYDPELSKTLLDEAGFKAGSDGTRFKLTLEVVAGVGETIPPSGEYIKQALGKVGIDVELRNIDLGGFIKRVYTDNDFDMTMNLIYAMPDPTIGVQRLYWSENIKPGVPFSNASGYSNPEMDRVLEAAQTEN